MSEAPDTLSYRDAGVDIDAGNELVKKIAPFAKQTARPEVMAGLGGFGAMFELPWEKYKKPVLVSATDGVGTKLKLAFTLDQHHSIGIDLVAMCANDLVVCGAEPLFFLDYYATGKLAVDRAAEVIQGIAKGCQLAGAALVGGETAEMPGLYHGSDYDLAGFCVGIVEKDHIIHGQNVKPGDVLLGLASSGVHSNGYSLVRKILEVTNSDLQQPFANSTLGETLLLPTRIYVPSLLKLCQQLPVHALAHITGGGLVENLPRVLPKHCKAVIDRQRWTMPEIFQWLQQQGNVKDAEMLRTFNCGIGMVVCVAPDQVEDATAILSAAGETVYQIGHIEQHQHAEPEVVFQ